jgi:S1-C subfamily serine protease
MVDYKILPNEEIHLLGYPVADNLEDKTVFHPTISAGKVIKINAHSIDFEADINKGDSGGPVINRKGKAIGVITNRAVTQQGFLLSSKGSAIKMEDVRQFVPELFDSQTSIKNSVRVR